MVENIMQGSTASVFHSRFSKRTTKNAPTSTQINLAHTGWWSMRITFTATSCDVIYGDEKKISERNFELLEHLVDEVISNQILKTTEDPLIGFL